MEKKAQQIAPRLRVGLQLTLHGLSLCVVIGDRCGDNSQLEEEINRLTAENTKTEDQTVCQPRQPGNPYSMVADDPESFADLRGHYINGADVPMNRSHIQSAESSSATANFPMNFYSGDRCDDEEKCQQAQTTQQQEQPLSFVTVLGNTVTLSYASGLSGEITDEGYYVYGEPVRVVVNGHIGKTAKS